MMEAKESPMPIFFQRSFLLEAVAAAATITMSILAPAAQAATPTELLAAYASQAGSAAVPARGQQFFTTTHGKDWSCASCHGAVPTQTGKHASTGKPIGAMAPAFNAERFNDSAKAEKWFRRNCNDVVGRECSAAEKADVLSWLLSLKP
jgi:non-ribosomal peptide synthetase component F